MTFATPALLWIAAVAPIALAILFAADAARRRALLGRLGEAPAVARMMASASPRRRRLKAVLFSTAIVLLLIAAARPQVAGGRSVKRASLDLVIAIDASTSMLVRDAAGRTRLERARAEAAALVEELAGERVSIVLFAGAAVHFPLTEDHAVALEFASEIGPADLPGGSDLGEALRVARCLLRPDLYDDLGCRGLGGRGTGGEPLPEERGAPVAEEPELEEGERGKAVLVLADGADSRGAARQEAERARELGIAVFLAGVGSEQGGRVPEIDSDGRIVGDRRDDAGQPVVSTLDEAALRALAAASGDPSRYLTLDPARPEPERVAAALRRVARAIRTHTDVARRYDVYPVFVFPAFLLLVIEACLGTRRRVRHPEAGAEIGDGR